jgi:hypothetical protein
MNHLVRLDCVKPLNASPGWGALSLVGAAQFQCRTRQPLSGSSRSRPIDMPTRATAGGYPVLVASELITSVRNSLESV